MTHSKNLGVLFCIVLLLVVVITNIPLRGLWSVVVIITILLLSVIFALMNIWEHVLQYIDFLDIRINLGGYIFISTVLLIIWLVAFLLFDQQVYMIFTPGQFRVRQEIGAGEIAHDTTGMTVQKQRSDLFRHWILGLGSGDLIVRTSGAHPMQFDLPNVLFLGRKVKEIEDMLRQRQVVAAPAGPAG
jgi:FlaA1/EpsC-like NDP-sugar epimerase